MVYAASSWRDSVKEVMDADQLVQDTWQCPHTGWVENTVYSPIKVDASDATLTGGWRMQYNIPYSMEDSKRDMYNKYKSEYAAAYPFH